MKVKWTDGLDTLRNFWIDQSQENTRPPPPPTPLPIFKDIQPSYMVLDVNNKKPSKEEIIKAMKLLKGEKAAGQDSIQANRLLEPVF